MKTKTMLACAISALALSGGTVAVRADQTTAANKAEMKAISAAQKFAKQGEDALATRKAVAAIGLAENAVKLRPADGDYRALLGRAYLAAGRFASARQAFSDALALDAGLTGVALNLALAETASGDRSAARDTLAAHADKIAPVDRGLALALAGDPQAGVAVLESAARAPGADATVRQNLALAYALANRWPEARTTAMIDLPPADADARIVAWAAFVRPAGQADQVASLLGVTPVADGGQPAMLALQAQPTAVAEAAAPEDPVDAYMPAAVVDTGAKFAPVDVAAKPAEPAVVAVEPTSETITQTEPTKVVRVVFGPRKEVVQPIPVGPAKAVAARKPAVAAPAVAAAATANGNFVVQLGAFRNAAAARSAWTRAEKSVGALSGKVPSGVPVATRRGTFYRLSVSGFARTEAVDLCIKVKAAGGACFVRATAGDAVANWAKPGVQVAAR